MSFNLVRALPGKDCLQFVHVRIIRMSLTLSNIIWYRSGVKDGKDSGRLQKTDVVCRP